MSKEIKPFKLEIGDKFVTRKDDEGMADFCKGAILTVSKIEMDSETIIYFVLETYEGESYGSWDNGGINWVATSKLNKLSKLSATITVVNPLIKIKEIVGEHPFKVEYYSKEDFCVSLYDSEVDIIYCEGRLNLNTDVALTRGMVEEVAKVMLIIEQNLNIFLLKEEVLK